MVSVESRAERKTDAYTMNESVKDEITVRIVYEGRAAKVLLDNSKLKEIEEYYSLCADEGASDYVIEESKKANAQMNSILGDSDRLKALVRISLCTTRSVLVKVQPLMARRCSLAATAPSPYELYKEIIALRPEWTEAKVCEDGAALTKKERMEIKPMKRIKMVMTRGQDDSEGLYNLLGTFRLS